MQPKSTGSGKVCCHRRIAMSSNPDSSTESRRSANPYDTESPADLNQADLNQAERDRKIACPEPAQPESAEASKHKGLVSGSLNGVAVSLIFSAASYVIVFIIARTAGAVEFGRYAVVAATLTWVELIAAQSVRPTLMHLAIHGSLRQIKQTAARQLLLCLAIVVCVVVFRDFLATLFRDPALGPTLAIAVLDVLPFCGFMCLQSIANAFDAYPILNANRLCYTVCKMCFVTTAVLLTHDIRYAFLAGVFATTATLLYALRKIRSLPINHTGSDISSQAPKQSVSILVSSAHGLLYDADIWLMQLLFAGTAVVGHYGAARNITKALVLCSHSLTGAMMPSVIRWQGFREAFRKEREVRKLVYLWSAGMMVAVLGTAVLADPIAHLLFGKAFDGTGTFLRLLTFGLPLLFIGLFGSSVFIVTNRVRAGVAGVLAASLILAVLGWVLTDRLGPDGVPLAVGASGAFLAWFGFFFGKQKNVEQPND